MTRVIDLYNSACRARLLGPETQGEDALRLRNFMESFDEPRRSCATPKEPSKHQVNQYTVWLTMRGVVNAQSIARNPSQPVTLSEATAVCARLGRDFITCSREETLNTLDSLQDFLALMLRYPMVPQLAVDTKECPECYYEADITADTWKEVRTEISCYHFTLRHEQFLYKADASTTTESSEEDQFYVNIDSESEMLRAGACGGVFSNDDEQCGGVNKSLKPIKFLEQLETLKRRDEMIKQRLLGKEIFHQVKSHRRTLEELEAPRYMSLYPMRCLYQYYGSLNRSHARAELLSTGYSKADGDALRAARLKVEELTMNLRSVASTGNNDKLLSYVCMAAIGPVRRYSSRYNIVAERIVLFKHLIASGFTAETASSLVKHIIGCKRVSMITTPLDKAVDRQLSKIVQPTPYNRKIASLIWLFSHITAYCTLRELKDGYVRMADSPDDINCDGIYVFDHDHIGFRLSRPVELLEAKQYRSTDGAREGTAPAVSAYMPFAQIMDLLALCDNTKERLCG